MFYFLKKIFRFLLLIIAKQTGYIVSKPKIFKKNQVVFLHIGKNAGTQIENILGKIGNKRLIFKTGNMYTELQELSLETKYFFSIRNPIDRFVSGFNSRLSGGGYGYEDKVSEKEKKYLNMFKGANQLAESLFRDDNIGKEAFIALNTIGHIKNFQCDTFKNKMDFLDTNPPIWIIRTEYLDIDLSYLLKKINIDYDIKKIKPSSNLKIRNSSYITQLNIKNNKNKLSLLAKSNLKKYYYKDFKFYKICEDWINQQIKKS